MPGGSQNMLGDSARLDWDDYRVFAAVALAGSLGAGAKNLRSTRQSVTTRINNLEDRLGYKLLNRQPQGVELTPEGERVLAFVEAAGAQLARAATNTRDASDLIEGECRIQLGDGMATYWFSRFVAAFGQLHPRIALFPFSSTIRTAAKSPSHDIQVQYSDTPDEALVASRVATLHFMLFASKDYLDKNGTPMSARDLERHKLVDFNVPNTEKGMFALLRGLPDRTMVVTNSIGTQCEAIRWGAGIGVLPSYTGLVHANLIPVIPEIHIPMPVYVCFEREVAKRPPVRTMLDFLKNVVFDPANMPWFADDFILPRENWDAIAKKCMDRALARGAGGQPTRPSLAEL